MLASGSVQEAQDMALIAQAATLEARVPFIHFFDGFRISHEVNKIEQLTEDDCRAMIDMELVQAHRQRAMNPERPVLRGTAQNPDVFFQAREACNPFYDKVPGIVQKAMDKFAKLVGRQYHLFDYVGAAGRRAGDRRHGLSGCGVVEETVEKLVAEGEKVGLVKVRLYRPFDGAALVAALPKTVKTIAVLDRTKEPGAAGEPLYQDVRHGPGRALAATSRRRAAAVIGGRYGLSSQGVHPGDGQARLRRAEEGRAQEPLHRRHQRRRDPPEPRLRSGVHDRGGRRDPGRVLRAGQRRHGRRDPQLGEDRRREHAAVRPGLLRLRLAQGRLADHLAPADQPAADQGLVPGAPGQLRGLPPVALPRPARHALGGRAGRRRSC